MEGVSGKELAYTRLDSLTPAREINPRRSGVRSLAQAKTIDDLRDMARRKLPNFVYEYLVGGADSEITMRRNRTVFEDLHFSPRVLVDVARRDLSTSVFGRTSALPFMVAPTSGNGLLWPRGDRLLAEAAAEAGIPLAQGTYSMRPIEDIASVPGLRHWFQLYTLGADSVYERLVERAAAAGCEALLLTVDGAISGNRQWDRKSYASPQRLSVRSKIDVALHAPWVWRTLVRHGPPNFENLLEFQEQPRPNMFDVTRWAVGKDPRPTWDTVARIRSLWKGRLVIKGVLRLGDVERASDSGADGVVLSNHGGRQLEPTISPMELLPKARASVGRDFTILIDSGFRRGHDIVAAHALGADCVILGRALLYGLAAGGKPGARRAIEILREEIDRVLALIGVSSIDALTPDVFTAEALARLTGAGPRGGA